MLAAYTAYSQNNTLISDDINEIGFGQQVLAAVRNTIWGMSAEDWNSLSDTQRADATATLIESYISTFSALPGGQANAAKTVTLPNGQNINITRRTDGTYVAFTSRTQLIKDLQARGIKITPENVVDIQKLTDGRIVFLETGNNSAGLQHIHRHTDEFAQKGISQDQIPDAIFSALQQNKVVGYQGSGTGRPIYEYTFNDQTHRIAITVGDNGFIVGANPTSLP